MKLAGSAAYLLFAAALLVSSLVPGGFAKADDSLLIMARSCGQNAYRTADGDCVCKRGHELRGGKCHTMRGSYRATEERFNQPGCWTWFKMCRENDVAACQFFEGSCT